eukprot:6199154-Pleurochrysis_carterae.AAC.4
MHGSPPICAKQTCRRGIGCCGPVGGGKGGSGGGGDDGGGGGDGGGDGGGGGGDGGGDGGGAVSVGGSAGCIGSRGKGAYSGCNHGHGEGDDGSAGVVGVMVLLNTDHRRDFKIVSKQAELSARFAPARQAKRRPSARRSARCAPS